MPDRRGQLEQFEEQQRAAASPDDNRFPSSTTRRFLHPRRRVTSIFPVAFSSLRRSLPHSSAFVSRPREQHARDGLDNLPAIPLHWFSRLVRLPCDILVLRLLFVKLTAYDSVINCRQTLVQSPSRSTNPYIYHPLVHLTSRSNPPSSPSQCLSRTRFVTTTPAEARSRAWPN